MSKLEEIEIAIEKLSWPQRAELKRLLHGWSMMSGTGKCVG
jgi:hypothetical protein